MSFTKTIIQIAREIDRANKRAMRERERRERKLIRERKQILREEERLRKQLAREEKARRKEDEKAAFDEEKIVFENRVNERRDLRLEFINKPH